MTAHEPKAVNRFLPRIAGSFLKVTGPPQRRPTNREDGHVSIFRAAAINRLCKRAVAPGPIGFIIQASAITPHPSRRGDAHLRGLLYEAATVSPVTRRTRVDREDNRASGIGRTADPKKGLAF
jgi:hypothetical protein